MRRSFVTLVSITALLGASTVFAAGKLVRTGEPDVTFTAVGPAGLKIKGETHDLSVSDHGADVSVSVPLSGLKTGISLRDNHMKEKYLQVEQYPSAELVVPRDSLKMPGSGSAAADAKGSLSLHGKTKPVSFHYEAKRGGSGWHVNGTLHLNMKDFGIDVPSYAGITVKPDVDVAVEFDVKES